MFEGERPTGSKLQIYRELALMAEGLFRGERDPVANAANLSALLWLGLAELNWAGFYFLRGSGLVLGPFQGKPACVRIEIGSGVCGTAAAKKKTLIVPDVAAFPGHIACDAASRSELVVPLVDSARLIGVLDLDSPSHARFDADDATAVVQDVRGGEARPHEEGLASCPPRPPPRPPGRPARRGAPSRASSCRPRWPRRSPSRSSAR
jgi:GAF domain-containing protein